MLSESDCRILLMSGFVHVTGLTMRGNGRPDVPVIALPDEYGTWDRSHGLGHSHFLILLITVEGEVWIAGCSLDRVPNDVLTKFCPNGRCPRAYWPTIGELYPTDIFCRVNDPFWEYEPSIPTSEEVEIYMQRQRIIPSQS